eukprot:TRINITY_DN28632_c0_g1_i1.p1 TRINITY_DN28632_c0_g1~~TRINITY_DN28632_c0_g1_i1.p1  ORF type:complete len:157 (-),score=36.62 TRINITY_DN28632_c0_g1_i1:32-448(-)
MTNSYPFGSPACVSNPRHGVDPQPDRKDLGVTFVKEVDDDGVFTLSVASSTPEDFFRGLLVQTKSAGEFLPAEGVAVLECNGFLGSSGPDTKAVTHTDSSDKLSARIRFLPDEGVQLEPEFEIVILKNFTTFWSEIVV